MPLVVILIFYYNNFIKYFSLTLLLIGIVGIIDSYYKSKKENLTKVIKVIDLKLSLDEKDHYIVDNLISIFDLTM